MSEKTLSELIGTLRRQSPGTAERDATVEMTKARITRAETAERLAEALMRTIHGGANQFAEWGLIDQYRAAREAVRKLEEQT